MSYEKNESLTGLPRGPLALIALPGCEDLVSHVDSYLASWRRTRELPVAGYRKDSFLLNVSLPRFGSGEGKGVLNASVRGLDIFIIADVSNYSVEYSMYGEKNPMSPDDHFQNLKRIIAAVGGKAKRVNVIMPFLYEGRQHKRQARESLDCAVALQELAAMGVENIITFDAHDPRVQNAIPMNGFETIMPTYQFMKTLMETEDLTIDPEHMMVISPDEGAIGRAIYFANTLGLDVGMFYKRRDYTRVVNGKNPIVAHEFLGSSVEDKDVVIVDDMIASGDSIIDVARQLKERKARKVFACATFGLFTSGIETFDKATEAGLIDKVYTTNLIYQPPEILQREYYVSVDMSEYLAALIDSFNHDSSIEGLLSPTFKIQKKMAEYQTAGKA
ncbi:MAG: ribose-phosphate pyrophosphokinase [Lachnospiraceae bacterium]|nr:ribose-phosphate pyrophosphokinase [Lachnospiraceae bacterium]